MPHCSGCGNFYKNPKQHAGYCELYTNKLKRKGRDEGIIEGREAAERAAQLNMERQRKKWKNETDVAVLRKELEMMQKLLHDRETDVCDLTEKLDSAHDKHIKDIKEMASKSNITVNNNVNLLTIGKVKDELQASVYEIFLDSSKEKILQLTPVNFKNKLAETYNKVIKNIGTDDIVMGNKEINNELIQTVKKATIEYAEYHPEVKDKLAELLEELD